MDIVIMALTIFGLYQGLELSMKDSLTQKEFKVIVLILLGAFLISFIDFKEQPLVWTLSSALLQFFSGSFLLMLLSGKLAIWVLKKIKK